MFPRVVLLVAFLVVMPSSTALPFWDAPLPPVGATADEDSGIVVVRWMPPPHAVDAYNVYGYTLHEGWVLLESVSGSALSAEVPAAYLFYGVSTTMQTRESHVAIAVDVPCVRLDTTKVPPVIGAGQCDNTDGRFRDSGAIYVGLP